MLDLLLMTALGFLGSFGHCTSMCGPLSVAFALAQPQDQPKSIPRSLLFHGLLNLGRVLSYTWIGAGIGALGSVFIAGGQFAGIDSVLRRGLAIATGSLLIWMGLVQVAPTLWPKLPLLHPFRHIALHQRLLSAMEGLSIQSSRLAPLLLGMLWGLIPCGFLYAAQIKAAATGNAWQGAATMVAFGVGTMPIMLGIGISTDRVSAERRSQLFRMGGWVMIVIGSLTLLRSSDMVDYTGHAALGLLMLALVARPLSRGLPWLLHYRRGLGVGAFVLCIAHTAYMLNHTFAWHPAALVFLLPIQQTGIWSGIVSLSLMTPIALTSFEGAIQRLGTYWHWIHGLALPVLILGVLHTVLSGSSYLGDLDWAIANKVKTGLLLLCTISVFLVRWRWVWSMFAIERFYGSSR